MSQKTYTINASLVIAKNHEGADIYVYGPAPVPDGQSDEWIKRHLRDGLIVAGDAPADPPAPPPAPEDEKPAGNASLEEWTAYALAHDLTEADLEGLKRDEIRDRFA